MMKDDIAKVVKLVFLVPLFVVAATLWIPFMIAIRLWRASADDVNNFFTPSNRRSNIVPLKNSRWH